MGLKHDIHQYIQNHIGVQPRTDWTDHKLHVAAASSSEASPRPLPPVQIMIEDVMSRLFRLGTDCSMKEIYENFIYQLAQFPDIQHFVFVFDKPQFKPGRPKIRPPSSAPPLADSIELCPAGYYDPASETPEQAHPVPLLSLLANRSLQAKLAAQLRRMTQADERLARWHLYWDCPDGTFHLHEQKLEQVEGNTLGEADLAVIWWAHQWRQQPVLISSIDSDVLLLAIVHRRRMHPDTWVHRGQCFWSLMQIHRQLERHRYSNRALLAGLLLSGADFVHKKHLLHGINDALIARGVHRLVDRSDECLTLTTPRDWHILVRKLRRMAQAPPSFHRSLNGRELGKPIRRRSAPSPDWNYLENVYWQFYYWFSLQGQWGTWEQYPVRSETPTKTRQWTAPQLQFSPQQPAQARRKGKYILQLK